MESSPLPLLWWLSDDWLSRLPDLPLRPSRRLPLFGGWWPLPFVLWAARGARLPDWDWLLSSLVSSDADAMARGSSEGGDDSEGDDSEGEERALGWEGEGEGEWEGEWEGEGECI